MTIHTNTAKQPEKVLKPIPIWTADFKILLFPGSESEAVSPGVVYTVFVLYRAHPAFSTHATTVIEGCGSAPELRAKVCFASDLSSFFFLSSRTLVS